jgi:hypothetical protein
VLEDAVDHVRDGLEAPMGMPRRALGLARRVFDLTHLVEVDERVEVLESDAGEGASDREPLPLESLWGRGDATHAALVGDRRIGDRDAREEGDVVGNDGGHVRRLLVFAQA